MAQSFWRLAALDRHKQRPFAKLDASMSVHGPADDSPGCHVLEGGDIELSFAGCHVSNIGQPGRVRPCRLELLRQEIGRDRMTVLTVRREWQPAILPRHGQAISRMQFGLDARADIGLAALFDISRIMAISTASSCERLVGPRRSQAQSSELGTHSPRHQSAGSKTDWRTPDRKGRPLRGDERILHVPTSRANKSRGALQDLVLLLDPSVLTPQTGEFGCLRLLLCQPPGSHCVSRVARWHERRTLQQPIDVKDRSPDKT